MNPPSPASAQVIQAWRQHRPYLVNLGYQILGDVGEAEDVAQEAFLRLSRANSAEIGDARGWLTVVTSRLCLDQVRSARARYERPSEADRQGRVASLADTSVLDPGDRVTLDDEIRSALLEVLRRLSPGERVAFVLHDVFGVPFDTIAEAVGRPAGTCRQLARRARAKFTLTRPTTNEAQPKTNEAQPKTREVASAEHQLVTEKFITACANGDIEALVAVLDPAVWGVGTVLVDPAQGVELPPQVNHGPGPVAANLLRYLGPGVTLVSGPCGQAVLLAFAQRRLFAVIVLTLRADLIGKIEATADPSARVEISRQRRQVSLGRAARRPIGS